MSKIKPPKTRLERYKLLWDISEAGPIIRRYFAMNFFDGVLTALGIVLAGFAFWLSDSVYQTNGFLFFSGLTTAIAIGISGLTGSHLAESAERSLNVIQMKQVLGLLDSNGNVRKEDPDKPRFSERDIQLALGKFEVIPKIPISKKTPRKKVIDQSLPPSIRLTQNLTNGVHTSNTQKGQTVPEGDFSLKKQKFSKKQKKEKKEMTIFEEAQVFAGRIAAFVDGFSPFAGVMVVILPFVFGNATAEAGLWSYIISFVSAVVVLFLLGSYLAKLSRGSVMKFGTQMVLAAVFTGVLTVFFNWLINNPT
ncbi:MAG: VIT1/CCC1 transporter family protein [Promethearchaeota archaeon]